MAFEDIPLDNENPAPSVTEDGREQAILAVVEQFAVLLERGVVALEAIAANTEEMVSQLATLDVVESDDDTLAPVEA